MKLLEEKILKEGQVYPGNVLKVGSFLNHQIDVVFMKKVGDEFYRLFKDEKVTKILTIEASGIGVACLTALDFNVPVVFAKKTQTKNIAGEVYTSKVVSFTHGREYDIIVAKDYLSENDRVLVIDDFLANGSALEGLIKLVNDSGATLVGAGIVIEKGFQPGGDLIRGKGVRVESLAIIDEMTDDGKITFRENNA